MTTTEQSQTPEVRDRTGIETHGVRVPYLGPILDDPRSASLQENVDDLESLRKASENRIRQLMRAEVDSDGDPRARPH